jgi:hypothetical protein
LHYLAKPSHHFKSPPGWSPQELGVGGKKEMKPSIQQNLNQLFITPPDTTLISLLNIDILPPNLYLAGRQAQKWGLLESA